MGYENFSSNLSVPKLFVSLLWGMKMFFKIAGKKIIPVRMKVKYIQDFIDVKSLQKNVIPLYSHDLSTHYIGRWFI